MQAPTSAWSPKNSAFRSDNYWTNSMTKHFEFHREYAVWEGIKSRCFNPKNKNFRNYGGRGITVCERWRRSFAKFIQDMGPRPPGKMTIERINNDGNYEPSNCRWAPYWEQYRNRRKPHVLRLARLQKKCAHARTHGLPTGELYCADCALRFIPLEPPLPRQALSPS
jgi:hypothetical protein